MTTTALQDKIDDFLAKKRIAIAGVSRNNGKHPAANLIHRRLKKTGHEVFAVNPHMQSFEGDPCYPDVQSIPGGVDAVVIVTRPVLTEQIVRECAAAGIHHVWMHHGLAAGSSVWSGAASYGRDHNISVIAGACPMMYGPGVDFGHACMRWIMQITGALPQ